MALGMEESLGMVDGDLYFAVGIVCNQTCDSKEMKIEPCVRCGFCCRRGPCAAGQVTSPTNPACRFLIQDGIHWNCGKYEEIVKHEKGNRFPMMGSGCSSTLFNEDRRRVIDAMAREADRAEEGNGENVESQGNTDGR